MRLRDLHQHLEAHHILKSVNVRELGSPIRVALEELSLVPSLSRDAQRLLTITLTGSQGQMVATNVQAFEIGLEGLRTKAALLYEVVTSLLSPQHPQSISIRIPKPTNLDDLKSIIFELQHVFEEPAKAVLGPSEGELSFQAFDVGTEWIELIVHAPATLGFIIGLLNVATWYQKQTVDIARRKTENETTAGVENLLLKYVEIDNALLDAKLKRLSKELVTRHSAGASTQRTEDELQNLVDRGIHRWAALVGRGATAVPALNATKEVRDDFPSPDAPRTFGEVETRLLGIGSKASTQSANEKEINENDHGIAGQGPDGEVVPPR